jgi:uncharacterized damage-inducible protein DinB
MTVAAIEALRAEQQRALDLFESLTPQEWQAASGCTGWRVQDVVQHMASTFHTIADPSTIDGGSSADAEENAEVPVQARRDWSASQVLDEYREWSDKGIGALAAMQEPPLADTVVPLANLGSHPLHILGNAIVFDHYCHLRHDIGATVPRAAALPRDDAALHATLEWMLAGLPQMCAEALAGCEQGVNLEFDGPGGGAYALAPIAGGWTISSGATEGLPTAVSNAHDFVSWGTKRVDWRDVGVHMADVGGARTLDAINVI